MEPLAIRVENLGRRPSRRLIRAPDSRLTNPASAARVTLNGTGYAMMDDVLVFAAGSTLMASRC